MRNLIALLIPCLMLLTGCDMGLDSVNASSEELQLGLRTSERPYKVTAQAWQADPIVELSCADGTIKRAVTGVGNGAHIGQFEAFVTECLDQATGIAIGVAAYVAANGDSLYHNYTAQYYQNPNDPPYVVHGILTAEFDGSKSTGRFAGATGTATGTLYGDMLEQYFEWESGGTISY